MNHQQKKVIAIGTYWIQTHFMSVNFPDDWNGNEIFDTLNIPEGVWKQIYNAAEDQTQTVYVDKNRVFEADSPGKALDIILENYDLLNH
jgi:hypothetical protein